MEPRIPNLQQQVRGTSSTSPAAQVRDLRQRGESIMEPSSTRLPEASPAFADPCFRRDRGFGGRRSAESSTNFAFAKRVNTGSYIFNLYSLSLLPPTLSDEVRSLDEGGTHFQLILTASSVVPSTRDEGGTHSQLFFSLIQYSSNPYEYHSLKIITKKRPYVIRKGGISQKY